MDVTTIAALASSAAAVAGVTSSIILTLQYRAQVRALQPQFWLEPAGGAVRDPRMAQLVVTNCGGSECFRVTAAVLLRGDGREEPVADRLPPRDSRTFELLLPEPHAHGDRDLEVREQPAGRRKETLQATVLVQGVRPSGDVIRRRFRVLKRPGGSIVSCAPVGVRFRDQHRR